MHDASFLSARPTIEVRDVTVSLALYRDVLGFEARDTMGDPPWFAILERGGAVITIVRADAPAVASVASVYLEVDDVDAVHRACLDAGVELTSELTSHAWGMKDFTLRDPTGHQIAVGQRLS